MNARTEQRRIIERCQLVRERTSDRILSKKNVIGSMIGLKLSGGNTSDRLCLGILVSKKLGREALYEDDLVPKSLSWKGHRVPTDVVEWPEMEEQSAQKTAILHDGRTQGTLSCFAKTQLGVFGLTCGHCLLGKDKNPATPTVVQIYRPRDGFVPAGQSVASLFMPGTGQKENFGYIDCGLFTLPPSMARRALNASKLSPLKDPRLAVRSMLSGYSMLKAPGGVNASPVRQARVIAIDQWAIDSRADFVIEVAAPGTFRGDSGILWFDDKGRPVGIHCRGEIVPNGVGSRLTTAMSAARAQRLLNVEFRRGD